MSKIAKAKFTVILNLSNFKTCQQVEIETKFSLAPRQPTQLKFNHFFAKPRADKTTMQKQNSVKFAVVLVLKYLSK